MAQTDIFQRQTVAIGGVFTSDRVKLTLSAQGSCGSLLGVLVQSMNFTYSQNVTRLYEVGSTGTTTQVYLVGGRTQGGAQLNRVVGPNATITQLYQCYGDVCRACKNDLTLTLNESACGQGCPTTSGNKKVVYTLKYCVLQSVGVGINAQDLLINEQCQIMFSGLLYQ